MESGCQGFLVPQAEVHPRWPSPLSQLADPDALCVGDRLADHIRAGTKQGRVFCA